MISKKKELLIGALLLLVGIAFIFVGILIMKQGDSLKKRCTEKAIGTVVEIISERESISDDYTDRIYYPVIEYQVGERTISQKSRSGQNTRKYDVGQQVVIYYNPNNVEEYFIKGDSSSQFIGIVFIVIGSVVAVSVVIFVFIGHAVKSKRRSDSEFDHTKIG